VSSRRDRDTYRQAGELLALLHGQAGIVDEAFEEAENARALAWLDRGHRIATEVESRLRDEIAAWPDAVATLVPTHGDWQPRNWLTDGGTVRVIDFGRAALRPAMSDFARLAAQDFARSAALEAGFLEGYGPDPREPQAWHRTRVREAIGTACWRTPSATWPSRSRGCG
jgi:thiamine kinase-like enzyme